MAYSSKAPSQTAEPTAPKKQSAMRMRTHHTTSRFICRSSLDRLYLRSSNEAQ